MIHPHFRGRFDRPEATGSDLVVQDVLDAVDFALAEADIDEDRVFVLGHSGGGTVALLMAGRHPDRFSGAVAWVPILDLTNWYEHTRESFPDRHYSGDIEAACGGDPTADEQARRECTHRSPMMHLDGVRDGDVRVYIGHGLNDDLVLPHRPLLAFNQLAEPEDRLPEEVLDAARGGDLPEELHGSVETEPYFGEEDPEVHLARSSGPVTVVLFEGQHDMVFLPGLAWMMVGAPG